MRKTSRNIGLLYMIMLFVLSACNSSGSDIYMENEPTSQGITNPVHMTADTWSDASGSDTMIESDTIPSLPDTDVIEEDTLSELEEYQVLLDPEKIIASLPTLAATETGTRKEIALIGTDRVASVNPVPAPKWWLVADITNATKNTKTQLPVSLTDGVGGDFFSTLAAEEGDILVVTYVLMNDENDTAFSASPLVLEVKSRDENSPKDPNPPTSIKIPEDRITVSAPDLNGNVTITGNPEVLDPGIVVLITNLNDGNTYSVISAGDGSFTLTIPGKSGDSLVLLTHEAGNTANSSEFLMLSIP